MSELDIGAPSLALTKHVGIGMAGMTQNQKRVNRVLSAAGLRSSGCVFGTVPLLNRYAAALLIPMGITIAPAVGGPRAG